MAEQDCDVLIVGAGVSGIGAACHLRRKLPNKKFAILEARDAIGGTWDLFRYPGIRSDSDMATFGYRFRPWRSPKTLADGPAIKQYISETAREHDVLPHISFGRKVSRAEWSDTDSQWKITARNLNTGSDEEYTAQYLVFGSGYYNHERGYTPEFPGREDFRGQIVHPQFWPEGLDYRNKKIVIIGSGATAVTLVPAMAATAQKVTMLQRSPTYIASVPEQSATWNFFNKFLPTQLVYALERCKNVMRARLVYRYSRKAPEKMRKALLNAAERQLNGAAEMRHFTPRYNPWDQRLCAVPGGDLFKAIRNGKAAVVTDEVEAFDASGILLKSGNHLDADIILTATGLELASFGGAQMVVNGKRVEIKDRMLYKGMMPEDVPNCVVINGYTNSSWTLKVDILCDHFMRLVRMMDAKRLRVVTPRAGNAERLTSHGWSDLSAGYIQRGADNIPKAGRSKPWAPLDDYVRDSFYLKFGAVTDEALEFRSPAGDIVAA